MHVESKRYLCTKDTAYFETLSQPSVVSLKLQGGLMSPEEVAEFEKRAYSSDAVLVRQWDDQAKVVDLETPPLSHFMVRLRRVELKGG